MFNYFFFFFQAEDGIRDLYVTGVQTCALPIWAESVTHDALKVLMDNGWRPGVIDALDLVAEAALFTGRYERAIRLITAAQEERTTLGLRSEEHTSELQSRRDLVCRLL